MPKAGEDYDIVIDDGAASPSTIQGLIVVRDENGQLSMIEDILPPVQSPIPQDSVSYASLPPDQEIVWAQRSWHNGFGKTYYAENDPFRYLESKGVDARFANRLNLSPYAERGGPLFADLGLEGWTSTSLLRSWVESVGSGGSIARETGAANIHEGVASAKMIRSGADVSISQENTGATKLAGEAVVFGAWVKQSAINAVRIVVSDAAGSGLSSTNGGTSTETDEWINITASHTLHASTTKVTFKVEVIADATVYVDQLYLTVGTETGESQRTAIANLNGKAYFNLGPYVFRQNDVPVTLSSGRPSFPSTKAGADVTDLSVYGSSLYVALGDGTAYSYSSDPEATSPTYTSSNLGDPLERSDRFGVGDNMNGDLALWKALDTQRVTTSISPTNSNGAYSTPYFVGDSDGVFTRMYTFAGTIVVAKTNGIYMYRFARSDTEYERFVNILQGDLTPRGTSVSNSVAYSAGAVYGDSLFVGKPNYGMLRIFFAGSDIPFWEPFGWLIGGESNADSSNYVMAMCSDGEWLYVLQKDSSLSAGGNAHLLALRQQSDGETGIRWVAHQILEIPNLQSPSSSDAPNANMLIHGRSLLIIGSAADINDDSDTTKYQSIVQVELPQDHENPSLQSTPKMVYKGTFVTSYWDANFPDITKQFTKVTLESESLSSSNIVGVEYQVDNETSWTSVGSFTTSPSQTISFPTQTTGQRLRLRLTMETTTLQSTGQPATTPVVTSIITHAVWSPPRLRRWRFSAYVEDSQQLRNNTTSNELGTAISANLNTMRDQDANVTLYTDVDPAGVSARIVDKVERYVSIDVSNADDENVRKIVDLTLHEVKTS
tara:strand:- start:1190 stop:3688 length:2499 start_codon:yes stop_codon:yes gene_type:complete